MAREESIPLSNNEVAIGEKITTKESIPFAASSNTGTGKQHKEKGRHNEEDTTYNDVSYYHNIYHTDYPSMPTNNDNQETQTKSDKQNRQNQKGDEKKKEQENTDTNTDTEKKEQEHDVDQKDTTSSDNVTKYKAMSDGKKRQQEEDQNNMNMERIEQRKKQIAASINVVKATATTTAKKRSRETNDKDNVSRNERKKTSKVSTTEHDRSNNNDNDTVNNSNYARPLLQKMRKKRKDHPTTPGQFDDAPDPMLERTSASASSNNTNRITNRCAAEAMVTPYFRSQLGNMFDPSGAMNTPLNLNPETRRILRQQLQQQRLEKLEKFWSEQRRQQPLQHLSPLQQQAVAVNAQLEVAVSGLADPYHEQQQRSHQQHLTAAAAAAATDKPVALTAAVTQETIDSPHGLALQIRLKTQILKAHMEYNAALLAIDRRNQMQQQQQNQAGNVRINYQPPTNKKQKT